MSAAPYLLILFFILGAIIASFVGVLVGRLHTEEGSLAGRSRCDACGKELPSTALVPIFSYFLSGGTARCCGARLHWLSPLSEIVLGCLFALAYARIGFSFSLFVALIALSALLGLVLYDLVHQILPPAFLATFVAAAGVFGVLQAHSVIGFGYTLAIAGGIMLVLGLLHVGSGGRAMGLADAPLAFGLALFAGPTAITGFLFSFWIGALVGISILAALPRGSRMGVEVPFAPFLAAGFLLAYFLAWNPLILIAALP